MVRASLARAEPAQPMVAFLLDHLTRNVTSLQEGQLAAYELAVQVGLMACWRARVLGIRLLDFWVTCATVIAEEWR